MSAADIKKVKMSVESLHSEKLKMEKNAKKPAPKNKGKVSLRTENDVRSRTKPVNICFIFLFSFPFQDIDGYQKYGNDFTDDYDDFMWRACIVTHT